MHLSTGCRLHVCTDRRHYAMQLRRGTGWPGSCKHVRRRRRNKSCESWPCAHVQSGGGAGSYAPPPAAARYCVSFFLTSVCLFVCQSVCLCASVPIHTSLLPGRLSLCGSESAFHAGYKSLTHMVMSIALRIHLRDAFVRLCHACTCCGLVK